jgi:hypothetical protein
MTSEDFKSAKTVFGREGCQLGKYRVGIIIIINIHIVYLLSILSEIGEEIIIAQT